MRANDVIGDIRALFATHGARRYGNERVTQLEHALQCAELAERGGAAQELIAAALLHDLGHLLYAADIKVGTDSDEAHDRIAARYLHEKLPAAIVEPIRLHVEAKRYLCATEPGYAATLSPASTYSLRLQGGAMTDEQARQFIALPFALDAVRLRRWDEGAKVQGTSTQQLEERLLALHERLAL